jgi:hypothetical protein
MEEKMPTFNRFLIYMTAVLYFSVPCLTSEKIPPETIKKHLEYIRSLDKANPKESQNINKQMDQIWEDFNKDPGTVLPILNQELKNELLKKKPAQYFLLDIASFIAITDIKDYYETSLKALEKIDPQAEIIQYNFQQLFHLFRIFALKKEKRILPLIPAIFLKHNDNTIFIVQHSLKLNPVLICTFLYGPYGYEGETHLREFFKENKDCKLEVLDLLLWIGSKNSLNLVKEIFKTNRDYDTFARCISFFMQMGGKEGKEFLLSCNIENYDEKSKKYFKKVHPEISASSFEQHKSIFRDSPGKSKASPTELKEILCRMYNNYRIDQETNPLVILNSELPADFLITELIRIRSRMFHRLSDEVLYEIKMTNVLINALQYR